MTEQQATRFDFETFSVLAQTDPRSFESLRQQAIDAAIERAPAECRQRLRRLQWRIDRLRETSRTPMAACILISNMMWTSFNSLNHVYQRLNGRGDDRTGPGGSRGLARVVPFSRSRGQ